MSLAPLTARAASAARPWLGLACLLAGLLVPVRAWARDEGVAVILAPGGEHAVTDLKTLAAIYRRRMQHWPDGSAIEPINLPGTDPLRQRFSQAVLGQRVEQMEDYWDQLYFHGVLPPHVMASPEAVLRYVAATPGAVGYVPLCEADDRVQLSLVVDLDSGHILPASTRERCHH